MEKLLRVYPPHFRLRKATETEAKVSIMADFAKYELVHHPRGYALLQGKQFHVAVAGDLERMAEFLAEQLDRMFEDWEESFSSMVESQFG